MAEPFQFDWTTAVPVDDEPQPSAPSTPTPPESIDAVMSATPFGAQNMPQSQQGPVDAYGEFDWKTAEPLDGGFDPSTAREATPAENAEFYEQVNSTAYLPTKDEWRWRENFRKQRDDKVTRFIEGGKAMAGGLVQAAAATAFAPFDFLRRGTVAYDEWVNSSAEGVRQTGIATAELWSWAGDVIADRGKEIERNAALDAKLRQQLASENRFTGNAETDGQVFLQAREAAMASGFYDKTPEELTEDEDTQYQRFIRDRSFQQQAENITETNIGTLPDGRAEMGIDESKLNPGLVTTTQLIADPLNIAAGGLGIFSKVRPLRRAAVLAGKPLELGGKAAGAAAQKADELYAGVVNVIENNTGLTGAQQMSALQNSITWKAAAAMATLKGAGGILRTGQTWMDTGSVFVREAGTGGVGVARVEAASKLRTAPIPERYRRAYDGFFTSADSTLRRVSETPGLSPVARRSAATLDRVGATQAFRVADDAIGGALATTPIAVPLAAISPEERQPEMLGALMTVGAVGGVVGGKVRRVTESDDALVAKMLADVETSGGDATSMANMLSHDKLLRMAQMQTVMSAKADFVPLRANDYELNPTVTEHMGKNSRGFYVDATKGQRPRVFVNLDKLATGDVVGHEIGHAILKSDILGGQIKQGMRSVVDAQYGADGIASRGREYVKAQLTQEVNHKATGIEIEVLTPEESQRKAAGVSMDELVADRWKNDPTWRDQQISERVNLLNQEALGKGEISFDWARDEIVAETFSGLGKGINVAGLRASGPMGRTLGAMQTAMETMGARFTGSGKLESPNQLFTENPLFDTPQMRKAVNNYVKLYDRYLVGLEKEGKVKQRGRPIAPTGRPEEAARSPHTRTYDNNGVLESELFIERPDGTRVPKSQQMIDTQEKARSATLKSINNRTRFVDENSSEWGARKLSNGRVEVGGPNLPPQFDYFVQVPQWLRAKAREFEAGRAEGRSYLYSNNAIGTRGSGRYKIKNLGNVEAKTGEMVPFGWAISTENHLLVKNIDLNSFRAATMRAIDKGQLGEFGNNLRTVEADLKQLMRNHEEGRPGETGLGVTKKNILNGLLGTGTVTQRLNNQAWHTLNNQGSIRTFRFDRLNYADQFDTGYFPHYQKININALPDDAGRMSLDDFMRFDADRQAAWLNNRARERGYTNSTNWANSDEAGFAAASDEYRKLFPRPNNNNRMPSALPQAGMAMPDGPVVGSRGMPEDYTNDRLRKLSDDYNGNDPNMTDQDVVEQMRFIIEDAPAGYFPKSLSDNIDKALRDIDEQYREWGGRDDLRSVERAVEQAMRFIEKPRKATGGTRGQAMPDVGEPFAPVRQYNQDLPEITSIDISRLRVRDAGEVRQLTPERVEEYRKYLNEPIEVSVFKRVEGRDSGELMISDGHHRVAAARALGVTRLPARVKAINAFGSQINELLADQRVGASRGQAMPDVADVSSGLPRRSMESRGGAKIDEDGTVTFQGREPKDWAPEDFAKFGKEFGVRNLGPLSKVSNIVDELGRPLAQIPGGLDGKFTYYDLLWLKTNAVDVKSLPVELHGKLTAKLARTMTPERGNDVQKFNGILFGMLSPNSPLLPNEFGQARMRFESMDDIRRFAGLLPDNPTKEQRKAVNQKLKKELGFTSAKSGGLGIGISVDLSNIVIAAKMFAKKPDFFIKKPNESWANFVDKLTTQVGGLGTKTASFGGVWQDPLMAGISAMDRHMARAFSEELLNNPEIRGRFEGMVVKRFNDLTAKSKKTSQKADAKIRRAKTDKAKAKAIEDKQDAMQNLPDPTALKAETLDDVLGQAEVFGADRIKDFVNEAVFAAMGSRKAKYLVKGGAVNPKLPESLQGVEWVEQPKDFQVMSDAYRLALEINAKRAKEIGIEVFPSQWTLWDRIRGRVEPHEAMFPGLEKLPALNDRQLAAAYAANKQAGYARNVKAGQEWKRKSSLAPSSLAYFTPAVLAAGAAASATEEQ